MPAPDIGISGFAAWLPRYRVRLADWCAWRGENPAKIGAVVGDSFRMRGPRQNVYTMAANSVVELIRRYDVDPSSVTWLGLGTESSTDNSAGAVIIKGMVDAALVEQGLPPLSRHCEVPEFKHACLGGVYALKAAARYLALDGRGSRAIVVSADVAEYAPGSSGEPTQGAGAVATLVEEQPRLLSLDLSGSGSASAYRGPDFRKPFARFCGQTPSASGHVKDFPVVNGKYSTTCYVDEVLAAVRHMYARRGLHGGGYFRELPAAFLHRPYARMPETGWAAAYLAALADGGAADHDELALHCETVGIDRDALLAELAATPDVYALVREDRLLDDVYPLTMTVLRGLRDHNTWQQVINRPMRFGAADMRHVGNLYTAALPAWMTAGLEEAARDGSLAAGDEVLTVGYGSGDAAETIPMTLVEGWEAVAAKADFAGAMANPVDLDQATYEELHAGGSPAHLLDDTPRGEFVITGIGGRTDTHDASGIERYAWTG